MFVASKEIVHRQKSNKRKISQLQVNRRNTTLTWSTFSVNVRLNILTDILFDEERVKP